MTSIKGKRKTSGTSKRGDGRIIPGGSTRTINTTPLQTSQTAIDGPLGKGFGSNFGTSPGTTYPTGNYNKSGGSNGAAIYRFLDQFTQNRNLGDALLKLFNGHSFDDEMWQMFYQFALQYGMTQDQRQYDQELTQDQRQYDWNLLQDSRQYDNPTNTLARFMGAGISRDAAIQLLNGSGSGGSVGSGSPVTQAAATPGTFTGTPGNQDLATAQTVLQAVSTVSDMAQQGIDMATAVNQYQMLNAQNQMTQSQLQAFNGVNNITQAFNRAVFDGTLSVEDVQGLRTADDYYKWITDHAETNLVKPLIQNGSVYNAFGSTYGRSMMNQHLEQSRLGRDSGTIFDSFLNKEVAQAELAHWDAKKGYQDYLYAIGELSRQDVEIQNLWNEVWLGNIQIEIAGKELEIKGYEANQAKTKNDIFNAVYNQKYGDNGPDTRNLGSGAGMVAYSEWSDLSMMFYKAFAANGDAERRSHWERFFLDHNEAAQLLAGLELSMARIQNSAANPDLNPFTSTLMALWTIAKMTGAYDVLSATAKGALQISLFGD